jgi:isoleucyl-tRNA synthetase
VEADGAWKLSDADVTAWAKFLQLRDEANKAIEAVRAEGKVGANASAKVNVTEDVDIDLLSEILAGAQVVKGSKLEASAADGHKCPRCWQYFASVDADGLDARCAEALK